MHMHPYVASQLARERHRDMLVQAQRQRRARQLMALARASRRVDRAEQRMRQAVRKALRLRAALQR